MRLTKTLLVALGATIALSAFTRAGAVAIDDAAIVGIFDAANTWDINTGSLAAKKGARADVRPITKRCRSRRARSRPSWA
jgi:hypothetical protein